MQLLTATLIAALAAQSVQAHWFLKCVTFPGETCDASVEGAHMAPYVDDHPDNPIWPRNSPRNAIGDPLMQCGPSGLPGADIDPISIQAGTTLTAWMAHAALDDNYDKATLSNHHGYTQVYLTPFDQANGQGKWTKIFTSGFISNGDDKRAIWADPANRDSDTQFVGFWATDELRLNGGKFTFTVPQGVPNGKYILRAELLTDILPETSVPDAQVYAGCVPLQVGSGTDDSAQLLEISPAMTLPDAYNGNEFVESYNIFVDLSRNIPSTPGGDAWTGAAQSTKRSLQKKSRHFHAHATS